MAEVGVKREKVSHRNELIQQLFNAVFDSSPIGIGVCDRDLRIVIVNEAWAAMDGVASVDHKGKTVQEVLNVGGCPVEVAMNQVLATGESIFGLEIVAKVPVRSEVGRWIVNLIPLKDHSGRTTHVGSVTIEATPKMGFESFLVARRVHQSIGSKRSLDNDHVDLEPLSPREIEVTRLLAEGKSNKEVASLLEISVKTVETHRNRIMKNLNLGSFAELVRYAVRCALVS